MPYTHRELAHQRSAARRGAAYVLVLGASLLIFIIGVSSLTAMTITSNGIKDIDDARAAEQLASSGIQFAIAKLALDADWKTTYSNGGWGGSTPVYDAGVFRWKLRDETDSDLGDDFGDPVTVVSTATVGNAQRTVAASFIHPQSPLDMFNSTLHAGGNINVFNNATLWLLQGNTLISTNGAWSNHGTVFGNVEATSVDNSNGSVTGTTNYAADPKPMPMVDVVDFYIAQATQLAFNGDMDTVVIAPGMNEYDIDAPLGNNIYYIDTGNSNIWIQNVRVDGTLVIDAGNQTVRIEQRVLMQSNVSNMPAIVVRGKLQIELDAGTALSKKKLSESTHRHNFNPPAAPYQGASNDTQTDEYPCEIRGLIYSTGRLNFRGTTRIYGGAHSEDDLHVRDYLAAYFETDFINNPPSWAIEHDTSSFVLINESWERLPVEN